MDGRGARRLNYCVAAFALASAALAFAACGGGGSTTSATATPAGASTAASQRPATPAPRPTDAPASKLSVAGGALNTNATAVMHTAPGASCSILYTHPSGKPSTAAGLDPKTADPDGTVTWTWLISPNTLPLGKGSVKVTCGDDVATTTITIVPAAN